MEKYGEEEANHALSSRFIHLSPNTHTPTHSARAIDVRRIELDALLALGLPSESIPGRALAELKARWREAGASGGGDRGQRPDEGASIGVRDLMRGHRVGDVESYAHIWGLPSSSQATMDVA